MSWSSVIGQNRVVETLRRSIAAQRVAHAYLFRGPHGCGKRAAALAFAMALECEAGGDEPCGTCNACHKVKKLIHPDVRVLFPYPKDTPEEDIGERLRLIGENPYEEIDYIRRPSLSDNGKSSNKQARYSVDRIHEELRRTLSYKVHEGRYKVAVVIDADALRVEAANAFLKLLEEPTPDTVFILTTARPDRLLPTVLSRCQHVRFDSLSIRQIEAALVERKSLDQAPASVLARMSGGSYTRAIGLATDEDMLQRRDVVVDFLRYSYVQNADHIMDLAESISRTGREQVKGFLALMLQWIRDLLLFRVEGDEANIVNIDQRETISNFCVNIPDAKLSVMVRLTEQALRLVERNIHVSLLLLVLSQQLARAMRGDAEATLPVSLVGNYAG